MRETTITLFLRQWLPLYFPVLTTAGHGLHPSGVGIYANRGRYHPTGRAADIYFHAWDADEKRIADALFRIFRRDHRRLGTDHVIWNREIWSASRGGPRRYNGTSPHTNHIHVYFTEEHADEEPLWLLDQLDRLVVRTGGAAYA